MDMPQRAGDGTLQTRSSQDFWQKKVQINISAGRFLAFLFFGGGLLIWVFFFGILLGGGLNPEEKLPELARLMPPQQESTVSDKPAALANQPAASSATSSLNGILRQDELTYYNSLKGTATPAPPVVPGSAPPGQITTSVPARVTAQVSLQRDPGTPANVDQPVATIARPAPGREVFDYIYQVAAFTGSGPAETLRKRLQTTGLKSSVEQQTMDSITWYRTMVHFRGGPDDTRLLRDKLSGMGIDRVLLRSKKPVTP